MAARTICNATSAHAWSGHAHMIQSTLLNRKIQNPKNLRRWSVEPTSQAAVIEATNAGHCKRSIHDIAIHPYCRFSGSCFSDAIRSFIRPVI